MMQPLHGLYAIVDPHFVPPGKSVAEYTRQLLEGGCRWIQLRVKHAGASRSQWAGEIMALKADYDFTFIVNDDVECAKTVQADGVHLGAGDMPPAEARAMLGDSAWIGYSAHALDEAVAAEREGAGYIALGAIFPTKTKGPGHPVQGLARLSEVVEALRVPVVAIGGITRSNVAEVWRTGVAAIAMITSLSHSNDPKTEACWFVHQLSQRQPTCHASQQASGGVGGI